MTVSVTVRPSLWTVTDVPVVLSNTGVMTYRSALPTLTVYSRRFGSKPDTSLPSALMPVSSALWVAAVRYVTVTSRTA